MVGSVIVRGATIIGEGYHRRAGGPHAEVAALRSLRGSAKGATVYVTLEPCDHQGRTGPCTQALIAAGVARVVFALRDPNPRVDGRGARRLRAAGITVDGGLLAEESAGLNRAYIKWITTGLPWVTLKAAVTLDGKIATRTGDSKWITGDAARKEVHRMRARHDAIIVGAGTVRADDPRLTVRSVRGRDPQRVIVAGVRAIAKSAKALPGAWVMSTRPLRLPGADVLRVAGRGGRADPTAILVALGERRITSVLLEGGSELFGAFWRAGLVDEVAVFVAPKLVGGDGMSLLGGAGVTKLGDATTLKHVRVRKLGDDVLVTGLVRRGP